MNTKSKALSKKSGEAHIKSRLNSIRKSIKKENVSYGELAELGKYKKHIKKSGDMELAQWAGIPEHHMR